MPSPRTKKPRAVPTKPRAHGSGAGPGSAAWLAEFKTRAAAAANALKGGPAVDVSKLLVALERANNYVKQLESATAKPADPGLAQSYREQLDQARQMRDHYASEIRKSKNAAAIERMAHILAPPAAAPRLRVHATLELPPDVRDGDNLVFVLKSHTRKR